MAQTGYTPIQLYHSTAAGTTPTAGNLLPGEPAINIADMALYFENSGGVVRRLMNNPAGLQYPVADGTTGQMLITNGSGVLSFTAPPAGTVTSVGSGTGLTGGPITSSGTLSIDTGVVVTLTGTQTLTNKTLTAPVLTVGTANGLVYLNGSAAMTSSSALTFNGSSLIVSVNSATDAVRITQTGAGNALVVEDSANPDATPFIVDTNGRVGVGSTSLTGFSLRVGSNTTGATTAVAVDVTTTAQSDVTANAAAFRTQLSTQAAAYTLASLVHFSANQVTIGATSAVTNQYGFIANSSLIGATNNFGFHSNLASGAGRWNFYAAGTAQNYFAGTTLVGTLTNTNSSTLAVGGTISETVSSTQYLAASQYDVGTAPNKIPLNQYLGALAYRANAMVSAPASATAIGNTGDIAMDSSYFYVCIAPNTWKRVAIATW